MSLDVGLTIEVDTGGKEKYTVELFDANITHNLGEMADMAGIYEACWHPEQIGAVVAGDIIKQLEHGLCMLKCFPNFYSLFNSPNGWGLYKNFVPWVERYLEACKAHPNSTIGVSV